MTAWEAVQRGEANPLKDLVRADLKISKLIPDKELDDLFQVESYTGIAEKHSLELARAIREQISR
jgi:adenylosuccinate lyase